MTEIILYSYAYFDSLLQYDPMTGLFCWKINRTRQSIKGKVVGKPRRSNNYVHIHFGHKSFQAHRLAWLLTYKCWPSHYIDHINGNKSDNRLANLRLTTPSQNNCNRPPSKANSSGHKGVYYCKASNKWKSQISFEGKYKYLGSFNTLEEAVAVRHNEEQKMHNTFVLS